MAVRSRQPTWTHTAVDGTCAVFTRNSMYQPGGATAAAAGIETSTWPPARAAMGRSTRRCEQS